MFAISSATTTLINHCRSHGLLLETAPNQKRFKSDGSMDNSTETPVEVIQTLFDKQLIKWIISSNQSFQCVENTDFIKLIQLLRSNIKLPCRTTVQRRITEENESEKLKMKTIVSKIPRNVSLTTDAWSSRIFKGYLAISIHWISNDWKMKSLLLDFPCFITPHTGNSVCNQLISTILEWGIGNKVQSITTDNGSDVVSGVTKLNNILLTMFPDQRRIENSFHIRCVAHVLNLAVKDCMKIVHSEISSIRHAIHALSISTKRRDIFLSLCKELHCSVEIPGLDVDTRWSSTFIMIKKAYKAKRVIMSTISRIQDFNNTITDLEWEKARKVYEFLETAATITENQSGTEYVTISLTARAFNKMTKKCEQALQSNDDVLKEIAKALLKKLESYRSLVCSDITSLARVFDIRLGNDIIADSDLLRKYIQLNNVQTVSNTKNHTFLDSLLDEDSIDCVYSDEITSFIKATTIPQRNMDPLEWWAKNESNFPEIAPVARDVLAIQATSVFSESIFSQAGHMISDQRTRMSDDTIQCSMLSKSWSKHLS